MVLLTLNGVAAVNGEYSCEKPTVSTFKLDQRNDKLPLKVLVTLPVLPSGEISRQKYIKRVVTSVPTRKVNFAIRWRKRRKLQSQYVEQLQAIL